MQLDQLFTNELLFKTDNNQSLILRIQYLDKKNMQLIKVGLCAFGMSGKVFHAPFLEQHPGFNLVAVVERHKNDSQEKYPHATIYRSVEEMLKNADLDIVIVNSPIQTHFDYVKLALEAGKNVICEKPFTINAAEAKLLVEMAQARNLFISVYQNRRFDRDFLQVKKILSRNVLGDLKEVEIRFDRFRTTMGGKIHKENPQLPGSGALHDLGAHLVDQAVQLFGKPLKVFGDVFAMKGEESANDYFEVLLFYPQQLRVRLKSSVFTYEDHYAYKLHGSKGSFLQERTDQQEVELVEGAVPRYGEQWQKIISLPDSVLIYLNSDNEKKSESLVSPPGNYMDYYQQIYEHVVFGYALPSPAEEIIVNMEIIDAALESSESERVIVI